MLRLCFVATLVTSAAAAAVSGSTVAPIGITTSTDTPTTEFIVEAAGPNVESTTSFSPPFGIPGFPSPTPTNLLRGSDSPIDMDDVVKDIVLERYAGTWYEAAVSLVPRLTYQLGCSCTSATYGVELDRDTALPYLTVVNSCTRRAGPIVLGKTTLNGRADPVAGETDGRLNVQFDFFGDGSSLTYDKNGADKGRVGNYWIVDLDMINYQWAIVGSNNDSTFYILTRERTITDEVYDIYVQKVKTLGLNTNLLARTEQDKCDEDDA